MQFGNRYLDPALPQVMGILNVTPDSFSDGGRAYKSVEHALRIAEQMAKDGASIIDIGGESTRPGAEIVSQQEELDRVVPVVEAIAARLDVVISVDTSEPQVITESVKAGAGLINDIRALTRPGAMDAAVQGNAAICLMNIHAPLVSAITANPKLPAKRWSTGLFRICPIIDLRDTPINSGISNTVSVSICRKSSTLCSSPLPKPKPGSSISLDRSIPAAIHRPIRSCKKVSTSRVTLA